MTPRLCCAASAERSPPQTLDCSHRQTRTAGASSERTVHRRPDDACRQLGNRGEAIRRAQSSLRLCRGGAQEPPQPQRGTPLRAPPCRTPPCCWRDGTRCGSHPAPPAASCDGPNARRTTLREGAAPRRGLRRTAKPSWAVPQEPLMIDQCVPGCVGWWAAGLCLLKWPWPERRPGGGLPGCVSRWLALLWGIG